MRIGILGGTFDPIHVAHLHAAETAWHQAKLDRVLFIPAGDPWQKRDRDVTDRRHRVAMVGLAIAENPGFGVDLREVDRDGATYTFETLASFPETDDLFMVMGADTALGIASWHRVHEVLKRANVLVVPRPGSDGSAARAGIPGAILLEMAEFDVSSTLIRSMATQGRPYRYLVPEAVFAYITENNLYPRGESDDMVGETTAEESSS